VEWLGRVTFPPEDQVRIYALALAIWPALEKVNAPVTEHEVAANPERIVAELWDELDLSEAEKQALIGYQLATTSVETVVQRLRR
jgi:hypothetical protein